MPKVDIQKGDITPNVARFFALPASAPLSVKRVANELKRQNERKGFITNIIAKEGYAIWEHSLVRPVNSATAARGGRSSDTVVIVPLVLSDTRYVNSFILAILNGTTRLHLFRGDQYTNHRFGTLNTDSITAEKLSILIMLLDKEVFGYDQFLITDHNLFDSYINISRDEIVTRRKIQLTDSLITNPDGSLSERSRVQVCTTIESFHCPFPGRCTPDGTCDECPEYCKSTSTTCTTTFLEDPWGNIHAGGGGGTSGGGSGGSGGSGGDYSGCLTGGELFAGRTPCDGGTNGPLGWVATENPDMDDTFADPYNPVDAPEEPVIDLGVDIYDSVPPLPPLANQRKIAEAPCRGNVEDLQSGTNGDATGIMPRMLTKTDDQLFSLMKSLFGLFAIQNNDLWAVSNRMINKFKSNSGGFYSSDTLNKYVSESSQIENMIQQLGRELNRRLSLANGNINNVQSFQIERPKFTGMYNMFHGLKILINDTECTEVKLLGFQQGSGTKWEADIQITIIDHFGLDKHDALKYQGTHGGFAAWWVLQHMRGYQPFKTKITITKRLSSEY